MHANTHVTHTRTHLTHMQRIEPGRNRIMKTRESQFTCADCVRVYGLVVRGSTADIVYGFRVWLLGVERRFTSREVTENLACAE